MVRGIVPSLGEDGGKGFYLPTWYGGDPETQAVTDDNTYTAAEGMVVINALGQAFLDFGGQAFVNNIGFGRREVADAMARQARRLSFLSPARFADVRVEYSKALVAKLPPTLGVPIFGIGGSDAVEAALRVARRITGRRGVVALSDSYHGDTMTVEAVSGTAAPAVMGDVPWAVHVPSPYHFWRTEDDWNACGDMALAAVDDHLRSTGGETGALIIEPVMGVAGAVVQPRPYLRGIRKLCDEHGLLLVLDEVITGFGRTGAWFGAQAFDVRPDVVVLAKGITGGYAPLGAVVLRRDHGERLRTEGFPYGLTFAAHPVACAAALEVLGILEREELVGHSRTKGLRARALLRELQAEDLGIRDVRGEGLLIGVELASPPGTGSGGAESGAWPRVRAVLQALRSQGFIVGCGNDGSTLILCPPFTVEDAAIVKLTQALRGVLREFREPSSSSR